MYKLNLLASFLITLPSGIARKLSLTTSAVSYAVFVFALAIVCLNMVPVFFPALLITLTSDSESQIDPLEPGIWAIPVLVGNLILVGFALVYYADLVPKVIRNSIKFILNFEVSSRVATTAFLILLGIYIAFAAPDLMVPEAEVWRDFDKVEKAIEEFPNVESGGSIKYLYLKNTLLYLSEEAFQNIKVIPFIGSISLLLMTYLFTVKIAKKKFAGLVAMAIVLQSSTFLTYDSTATYSNFWTLFYLLSLYLIYKKWPLSPVSFIASLFSKPLTAIFLPMTFFFIYRMKLATKKKIFVTISYIAIIVIIWVAFSSVEETLSRSTSFNVMDFWSGFTTLGFQLRWDGLVLVFLVPLTVGLFLTSKKGFLQADFILVLIAGILFSSSILAAFTIYDIQPYRYIPMIVFFAIGVGTLLSRGPIQQA